MTRQSFAGIVAVSAIALISLSGCSMWRSATSYLFSDKGSACPDVAILAATARLPAFDPAAGLDPSGVLYTIDMTNVSTRCDFNKHDSTADMRLKISYDASRAPGGRDASYRVPFFIAVMNEGKILDKDIHWLDFGFREGAAAASGNTVVESTVVHVAKGKKPFEYHMVIGFQLTKAQVDFNNRMGQFAP